MLSVEDIAAVKVAIQVCNLPEIKKEILCTHGSYYDINTGTVPYYDKKKLWDEIVQKKATVILEKLGIAKHQQEKVMGIMLLAGMRMLTWAEYHEGTLGISREYSVNFLNNSFFTQQGIIDNKKAAEELMKDERLNTKQKYKLACLYCFVDHIPVLYKQMTKEDKKEFYDARRSWINQPELVKFWSYYLMGEIDKLKGGKNLDQYRLEKAVKSGSKASVEYCLDITKLTRKRYAHIVAAMEAVKCRDSGGNWGFRGKTPELWMPNDFYVDILCFLLSKMGDDQQIEFLKQDIAGAMYKRDFLGDQKRSIVLEYFLDWPYQDYFMKTVRLMWEFLPENDYSVLLLRICDKIKPRKEGSLKYGEERSFDYRELLRLFWHQSPERYKRYVFTNHEVDCEIQRVNIITKAGVRLIIELLTLKNYTCMDGKNIQLILSSATDQEKKNFISSKEWRNFCFGQMIQEKWGMLDRIVLNCFLSEDDRYKNELCFTKEAKRACIDFIKNAKWNAAETFIKWSSLSEEEVNKLKKEILFSEDGRNACVDLFSNDNKFEPVDQFIRWCVSSEEEVKEFRKELVFSDEGTHLCAYLVEKDELELASEFLMFCLSSEEEVVELKKKVAHRFGGGIFENLISDTDLEEVYNTEGNLIAVSSAKFKGSKWEQVEQFLTWCFSSEEEMSDFKKNVLLKESGKEIHFKLINLSRWDEAETFFAWLGLSTEEIKELKKETLFHYDLARETFFDIICGEELIDDYGNREEAIELLLRWYLTDIETVLEFKDEFKRKFLEDVNEKGERVLSDFDSMIQQRLRDLKEEKMVVKRKSVTVYPCKRFRNFKCENTRTEYGEIE